MSYLIVVTNAANAVRVKFFAECKKIPEKNEKITVLDSVYIAKVNVLFHTISVQFYTVISVFFYT